MIIRISNRRAGTMFVSGVTPSLSTVAKQGNAHNFYDKSIERALALTKQEFPTANVSTIEVPHAPRGRNGGRRATIKRRRASK
jgi:hypothetical protein